jgi:hypothetical protein
MSVFSRKNKTAISHLGAAALGAALYSVTMISTANAEAPENLANADSQYVWKVDMRGKPPYKRERVKVPVLDVASMEVDGQYLGETTFVWERESTGRPPFKRERIEVPVVDTAAIEVLDTAKKGTVFRGRPPFRRHR